jgi:hypothetical protein
MALVSQPAVCLWLMRFVLLHTMSMLILTQRLFECNITVLIKSMISHMINAKQSYSAQIDEQGCHEYR